MFGSSQATTFTVNNATSLNATSPAGSAGTVNITVTTPGGSATISYTYIVPTITGISPASGPTTGGTLVNITGTNLAGATSVTFGGTAATINSVTNTLINATTPPGSTGAVNVSVVTPNGTGTEAKAYTYGLVPTVASISPIAGPLTGSQSVTITGANFNGTISVYFGGNLAPGFTVINSTSIIATTPPGTAGLVSVWVITPYGSQFLINAYTYESAPTVTGVSPAAGLPAGGTSVTINGTNFIGATAVTFGTTAVTTFTVNTLGTQITVNSPSGTGTIDITVTTPSGTSATSSVDRYIYTTPITAVTITGTAQVASTLNVGALTPAGAIATYQWEYSSTSGGPYTNISGATASTFSVTSGYVSDYIEVAAAGSGGYSGTVTSAPVGPVSAEPLTAIGAITGTAQVGSILTAGSISPSGATVTYQWEYSTTSGGTYTNISGATASTFSVTSGYVSDYIEVAAAGSGGYSGTVTSAPVGPVSAEPLTAIGAITGTAQVGSILTAGSISPSGATVTYQWEYSTTSGGTYTVIPGATSSTYTMASAYVNDYIKVAATGSGSYSGTVTSTAVGPVTAEPLTAIGPISGTAQVGSTLTAGALTPSGATAIYQWEYSSTSGGTYTAIPGATSSTYTVASAYVNDYIEVAATGLGGYSGTVTSTAVGPVSAEPLTAIGAITGTAQVGSTLTAGALTPSGATAIYQWEYSTTSGGTYTAIPGATSSTYLIGSYAGDYIEVAATGSGTYSGTVTSAPVGPVSTQSLTGIGAIAGTTQVGSTLTAGSISPSGATVTYQWEYSTTSGGTYTVIPGATSSTYTMASAYVNDYIKVAATGSGGYTGTVTSTAVGPVSAEPITAIGAITGTAQVGSTLTAGALTPSGATATYQWEYSTTSIGTYKSISGATSSTYTVASSYAKDYLEVVATGSSGYTGTVTSAAVGPVTTPLTAIGAITGTVQVGSKLTAGSITPSGATVTYQWEYSTTSGGTYTAISGATSSTYTVASAYVNDYIEVAATGSGSYSGTVTSAAVGPVSAEPLTAIGAITGTAAVGDTLTAGALTPSGATATYQWEYSTTSGGTYTGISGATSSTYTISLTYDGDYIKVAATGSGGYTGTVTSAATAKVT